MTKSKPVFSDDKVHVMRRLCPTCIFHPGNLMSLNEGRVESMVQEATRDDGCIPCHSTIHGEQPQQAVCRGFFDRHATAPLQIAQRLGYIEWVDLV